MRSRRGLSRRTDFEPGRSCAHRRIEHLCAAVNAFIAAEAPFDGRNVWRHPILAKLAVDDATLAIVDSLMGTQNYAWHHVRAARHDPGLRGIAWHHDYEQIPQTNRHHLQVHVLHYLRGPNGTIGDLLLLPGSHRSVMRRDALSFLKTQEFPQCVVIDELPPGSTIFVHSALVHARRSRPGGDGQPRYFIDNVYMHPAIRWPSYGRDGWRDTLTQMAARYRRADHPRLFDADAFFDIADGVARMHGRTGSLALDLPPADSSASRPVAGAIPIVQ